MDMCIWIVSLYDTQSTANKRADTMPSTAPQKLLKFAAGANSDFDVLAEKRGRHHWRSLVICQACGPGRVPLRVSRSEHAFHAEKRDKNATNRDSDRGDGVAARGGEALESSKRMVMVWW